MNLDLKKLEKDIENEISKKKEIKTVLLQFPDGLKPYSLDITKNLKEKFKDIEFNLWLDSNFGACDTPNYLKNIDLIINIGHAKFII